MTTDPAGGGTPPYQARIVRQRRTVLLVAVLLLLQPALVRSPVAVAISSLGALLLVALGVWGVVPFASGPLLLDGPHVTATTGRGVRTLDLSRLESVGGYRLRTRDARQDFLSLRDDAGTWLVLIGRPGFPAEAGPRGAARLVVHRAVRDAVRAGQVVDVTEHGKAVLGLPARPDLLEGVLVVACWTSWAVVFLGCMVLPALLWSPLVPV